MTENKNKNIVICVCRIVEGANAKTQQSMNACVLRPLLLLYDRVSSMIESELALYCCYGYYFIWFPPNIIKRLVDDYGFKRSSPVNELQ